MDALVLHIAAGLLQRLTDAGNGPIQVLRFRADAHGDDKLPVFRQVHRRAAGVHGLGAHVSGGFRRHGGILGKLIAKRAGFRGGFASAAGAQQTYAQAQSQCNEKYIAQFNFHL